MRNTPPLVEVQGSNKRPAKPRRSDLPEPKNGSPCAPADSLCFEAKCGQSLPVAELEQWISDWAMDGELRLHSARTVDTRRNFMHHILWFLEHRGYGSCGTREIKEFLHYLQHGHKEPGGRWGKAHLNKAVRPVTVRDYHNCLSTFFKFLVQEGALESSPMDKVPVPLYRAEQKQPYTSEQVEALLKAARQSRNARRDEAICLMLLDTGIRASELVALKFKDVDMNGRYCVVQHGKGNKRRYVHFGLAVASALRLYLRQEPRQSDDRLFLSDRKGQSNRALTRWGLLQLIERLGKQAGIEDECNVHRMRRTFATEWLRAGGNIFSLQAMLGHTNLQMTQRYLALARADIEAQVRQFSPADRLRERNRNR